MSATSCVGRVGEVGAALAERRCPGRTSCAISPISQRDRLPLLRLARRAAPRCCFFSADSPSSSLRISISSSLRSARSRMLRMASAWMSVSVQARHHHRLRLVLLADDADHLVEVEIGDQVAAEDFQPLLDLAEPVAASGGPARPGGGRASPAARSSATARSAPCRATARSC